MRVVEGCPYKARQPSYRNGANSHKVLTFEDETILLLLSQIFYQYEKAFFILFSDTGRNQRDWIEEVVKEYGLNKEVLAVDHVNLSIRAGSIYRDWFFQQEKVL